MEPIYTADNCTFAYPLQWGLTIFWLQEQERSDWVSPLSKALEPDGIRILNHRWFNPKTSQFAISTKPDVSPSKIVQRVKGRLQYLIRDTQPKPFQQNFAIRAVGSNERTIIERYVSEQTSHHPYADEKFQQFLENLQIHNSTVDLSQPLKTSHGLYWYNLHVVMVHRERWVVSNNARLIAVRYMIPRVCSKKGWRVSEAGILPDHVHLAIGCVFEDTPLDVALCFLNNLAYVHGMKDVFQFGGFVGTFGEYNNRVLDGDVV